MLENSFKKKNKPESDETISQKDWNSEREAFIEKGKFILVNKVICYGITSGDLHIHLAPAYDLSTIEKIRLLEDGLRKIAVIVSNNPEVEEISATSWIVLKKPEMLQKLGFIMDNSLETKIMIHSERIRRSNRSSAKRAFILRQDFLDRYLNK